MDQRTCTKCGVPKPLDAFYVRRNRKGGMARNSDCIACIRAAYSARPLVEPVMDGTMTCMGCGAEKHVTEFPRHKREKNGRHKHCKTCHSQREKARRLANPEEFLERKRTVGKASELMRNYNLSLNDYKAMLKQQGGGCAVCGVKPSDAVRHLAVDHDHACCPGRKSSCGQCIRGLLCSGCNRAIAWLRDDPKLMRKAARYVERGN